MNRHTVAAGMESDDDSDIDDIVFPPTNKSETSQDTFVPLETNLSGSRGVSRNYTSNGAPGTYPNQSARPKDFSNQRSRGRGVSYSRGNFNQTRSRGHFNQRSDSRSNDPSRNRHQTFHIPKFRQHASTEFTEKLDDLRYAITTGNLETTKELLAKGIPIDTILKAGWTGLMYACSSGYSHIVSHFLENKADPNYHKDMYTPLMAVCASRKNQEDLLKCCSLLLQHGANVNAHERHLTTPLMFAAREGYLHIVKELITHGADTNSQDNRGKTALSWATSSGHGQIIRLLLQNGADKNICDNMGQSPEDIAYESGYKELVSLIKKCPSALEEADVDESSSVSLEKANNSLGANVIDGKTKTFAKVGELELFLSGIGCSTLIKKFKDHDLTFHDLLIMNEEELEKIGIPQVGVRKKILEACKSIHKKEWETSSLPNLKQKQYISCPDAVAMVANIAVHLKFISSSVKYVRQQIQAEPRILELAQDSANVHDLIDELKDSLKNVHFLNEEIRFLKLHLETVQNQVQYTPADLVVEAVPRKLRRTKIVIISVSVAAGAFAVFFTWWKNPSLFSIPTAVRLKSPFFN